MTAATGPGGAAFVPTDIYDVSTLALSQLDVVHEEDKVTKKKKQYLSDWHE